MKKVISLLTVLLAVGAIIGFVGCEKEKPAPAAQAPAAPVETQAVAPADAAGFEEFPIGDDIEVGPLNVAAVYFQPVVMEPIESSGLTKDEASMHIEADISALAGNNLGFGKGDWVPYLTVDYTIANRSDGKVVLEGSFMPMSASDGPHYGANILLEKAGQYLVTFSIKSPENNGYLLHVDKETGVSGKFWKEPLIAQWEFDYVPREW